MPSRSSRVLLERLSPHRTHIQICARSSAVQFGLSGQATSVHRKKGSGGGRRQTPLRSRRSQCGAWHASVTREDGTRSAVKLATHWRVPAGDGNGSWPGGNRLKLPSWATNVSTWQVPRRIAVRTPIFLMSAFGPKQTCASAPHMSAFGGKADMTVCGKSAFAGAIGGKADVPFCTAYVR